jgi:uncharacterized protein YndB with AHSA1/START domain
MSVRKDPDGRRWVQVEAEVPGTPEQVWQAIATGPGVSSWFVPTEKREDGAVVSHFGPGMDAVATETAWDPPHRFAAEGDMGPGAPKMATEWIMEARTNGTCVVRVVHSLFSDRDDWDGQLESIEGGWPDYFENLRLYLKHFSGQPCSPFQFVSMSMQPVSEVWDVLTSGLGLAEAKVGEHRQSPEGAPRLSGVVERTGSAGHPWAVLLRLDQPAPGMAHLFAMGMGGASFLVLRFYLFGDEAPAAAAEQEPRWQAWLAEHFPPPAPPAPAEAAG